MVTRSVPPTFVSVLFDSNEAALLCGNPVAL
jgi:hypothetical protein